MGISIMKNTDITAKSDSTLNGEQKKDLIGIVNIFQLMDLVAEKQNYLEMLQSNGIRAIEGQKENGNEFR
jgi:hypothetical protein